MTSMVASDMRGTSIGNTTNRLPYIGCIVICILMLMGAMSPSLTIVTVCLSAIVAMFIGGVSVMGAGSSTPKGVMLLLCIQNLAIGVGAHAAGNESNSLNYLTQIPFIVILIIWMSIALNGIGRHGGMDKTSRYFIALSVCIVLSFMIARGNFQTCAITIRNLTVFYFAYRIGYFCLDTERKFYDFLRFIIRLALIVVAVGELLVVGGYELYRAIGIHEVYIAKGTPFAEGGLDARFYTSLVSKQYLRMGSIYYEPINLAYLLAAALLVSLFAPIYRDRITRIVLSSIIALGLIQTVGKGGYLITASVIACLVLQRFFSFISQRMPRKKTKRITIFSIILLVVLGIIYYAQNIGAAIMPHIWGITGTWENVLRKPWGYGLGVGGNAAHILGDISDSEEWLSTGGETALMSYMYQIGIQGVVCFSLCLINTGTSKVGRQLENWRSVFYYLPFCLLGVSLMQDNTFTPQCVVIFMLLAGGMKASTNPLLRNNNNIPKPEVL